MTRGQVALLAGFTALAPLAIDMYLPALPLLAHDLQVSVEQAGQSVSVFFLGIAAGQLVAGPLSDRLGRRRVILAGAALFVLAALAAALTHSFHLLLAARLAQAMGACAAMVSARAVGNDHFGETESARFISLLALIGGLAPIGAPLLGAGLIVLGNWRIIFLVMAGYAGLMLLLGLLRLPESRSAATREQAVREHLFAAYWQLLRNQALWPVLAASIFNSAAFFTYIANASIVLVDGYRFSAGQFSLLFALNSLALVGSSQINRVLLRHHDARTLLRLSARTALILAVLLLGFAVTQWGGLYAFVALLFLAVGSFSPVQANAMAVGLATDRLRAGSCAALFGATGFAGGGLASWIAGLLYDGTPSALTMMAALCLLGGGLSLLRVKPAQAGV